MKTVMPVSQHEDCIFCKIVHGEIPCTSVFESEELIAFLDISPVNKGHTLLVPKAHMETLFDMPDDIGQTLLAAMKQVGTAVMEATGAKGLNVVQNNYPAAGQQVPHVHWHLIPRFADDGHMAWPQGGISRCAGDGCPCWRYPRKIITDNFKHEQKRGIFFRCRHAIFLNYR